jgi:hypothetical protein
VVRDLVLRLLLALCCVIAPCLCSASAYAQLLPMREHLRQMDSGRLALSADLNTFFGYTRGAGYSLVQPSVLAGVRFREVVLEGAFPFAYYHENNDPGDDHDQVSLGNPWGALLYLPDCDCGLSRLSVGMAAPLASGASDHERIALGLARGAVGDWDGYLWLADALPLVLGASTRLDLGRLRLVWDADAIIGLPGNGREPEFGAQMAGQADLMFGWQTTLVGRISGVYYPTFSGDVFQSALTFYLRYSRMHDSYAVRFLMNLDDPAGFAFPDGIWGLGLSYARSLF